MEALVSARSLTKLFGDLVAVDAVDFEVRRAEAFGFLGPNGAGKTSTMRMIGCTSPPSGGSLTVIGMDPVAQASEIKRSIGVVPQIDNLDIEPTTGLDPQARHLVWDRLYRLKQGGATLIITTHYMDEAEQLCDRLVIMDKARIVAEDSPRELIDKYCT